MTGDASLGVVVGLGFLLGVRHAMDADHVAAVSTFVSQTRSPARSCLVGVFWGAGHTLALLVAGVLVIVFKLSIAPAVAKALEIAVALALILLGGQVLLRCLGAHLHGHAHAHGDLRHRHLHLHLRAPTSHGHRHLLRAGGRPFLLGVLHGMAGSAALMLLVVATVPSPIAGFVYLLTFGVGSTGGMLLLSGLLGIPFAMTADRSLATGLTIQALAGAASLIVGVALAWNLGSL